MTVAPSLFGISWHKERRTKNKWLHFCPLGFSRFLCSFTVVARSVSVYVSLSIRRAGFQLIDTRVKSQRWVSDFWSCLKTPFFLLLLSLFLLFSLKSHALEVRLLFCLFHFLFFCFLSFFVCFFLVFSLLSHAIVHFEIICTLSKHVSVQNAFMYKNMYTPKWEFVGTYEYTYMFRRIKGEERKFLGTMLCIFWFTFFFMHIVVCVLLVGQKYWKV